ncbi:UDP-GlcNAc:undecaprenyl-phosphate GlcNAc-1-phosphate transferase [Hathewaya proteolytica DSM 3090]|uniref:UDP-GlcNAc:undecaprenyl-phosphate GlcNAc-1-phosphate transferase n=1 Tax=Hathewaya proteolytica DSM 3090 TaxID=1121331 RepID=A0A1M6S996_9CLOT|nr:MraY family glycosyltransferase [Hathewaya proteolytica]SHK41275.1 UDP-GlcNAc:undecaprenyl-phosphate GlcNAc-1-phosphate transferase [Hathewaya proteolytica DSM 3090]
MKEAIIYFIIAMAISTVTTPLVRKFAVFVKAMDVPRDNRRVHNKPIPLLGGLAIYIAVVIGMLMRFKSIDKVYIGIIIGTTIIVIGGFLDDKIDLRPIYKIIFQVSAAVVVMLCGIKINIITNPFSSSRLFLNLQYISIPITIIWIVGVTNAFNLIDGLDGLSTGIGFIASANLFIIAILNNRPDTAVLTAILGGALLGFLPFNFNPASIFLGDTGAQLIGFLLAVISIDGAIKSATAFALAVPILTFGLPIYDTLFAVVRRKINGKPITQGDKGHLHHRLLSLGLTQRQVVLIMYSVSIILGGISILAMEISGPKSYFLMTSVIVFIMILAWKAGFFKSRD